MEYKELLELPNTYPDTTNYKTVVGSNIQLNGLYPEKNTIKFEIPKFENITPIAGCTFRFILIIKDSAADFEPKYYTSAQFYTDLEFSLIDTNPYFITQALKESLYITVTLDKQIELFNSLKLLDIAVGVKQYKNLFIGVGEKITDGNVIDYEALVRYIDWVVGQVNPLDTDTDSVLPVSKVANYEIGEYDPDTGDFISKAELAIRNKLEDLYDELDALNETLAQIAGEIREPQEKKTTLLDGIMLGLSVVAVVGGAASGVKAIKASRELTKELSGGLSRATQNSMKALSAKPITLAKSPLLDVTKKVGTNFSGAPAVALGGQAALDAAGGVTKNSKNLIKSAGDLVNKGTDKLAKVSDLASSTLTQVLKSAVKPVVGAVVKAISKQALTKAFTFLTGPAGVILSGAIGITKFFIGKAEEKRRFEAEKKEYALTINQIERLHQRKGEIESEIDGILTGRITLDVPKLEDSRLTATQKYLQNYGKKVLDRVVTSQG
jgi:ABC-type multidrug transport system fused ATPase/permease subunit